VLKEDLARRLQEGLAAGYAAIGLTPLRNLRFDRC
jgi:hypothetical protein